MKTTIPLRNRYLTTSPHHRGREVLPIRHLHAGWRERIYEHLMALDANDRYLRFGYGASDDHVRQYVDKLDFKRDEIFGIVNRRLELIAVAHLALLDHRMGQPLSAEFGVSVAAHARGRGYGARLFERAVVHARNHGVAKLVIYALDENTPMLNIARKAGATVTRDGGDCESWLYLPEPTLDTRIAEAWQDRLANTDYWWKWHAKALQHWFRWAHLKAV